MRRDVVERVLRSGAFGLVLAAQKLWLSKLP